MVTPYGNKVLIEIEEVKTVTAGGIHIPQSVKEDHDVQRDVGRIVAFGPLCFEDVGGPSGWGASVGDRVLFTRHGGRIVPKDIVDGKKVFRLINDEDLTAKLL